MEFLHYVFPVVLSFGLIAIYALLGVYAERKIAAFIQDRVGPDEVGPYGLLQTFADILKLLQKELIFPNTADKILFYFAPILVFASVFAGFAVIPFGQNLSGSSMNLGLLWAMSIVSIDVVGLLMAGWGSNNKYALMGSVRAVSQMIAYEVPLGFAVLSVIITYGTMDLHQIICFQTAEGVQFGLMPHKELGGFFLWSVFQHPHLFLVFWIFFIAGIAESNRAPFDLAEAESELVSGFHIEYSGFQFAALMLAEYANMLLISMISVVLFFGGWTSPLPSILYEPTNQHLAWNLFWFLSKSFFLVFVMMWIRWSWPRLRADQLMRLCWKFFLPISLILMLISAIWKYVLISF